MADRTHRLARLGEGADEVQGFVVDAQLIGVRDAAWQQQGVIVAGIRLLQAQVDLDLLARGDVVEGLDLAGLGGDQVHLRARCPQGLQRLGELDLFDAVGGHDGDLPAFELSAHGALS